MTSMYIGAAWVLTFLITGGYAASLVVRGRALAKLVPENSRRWMQSDTTGSLGDAANAPANATAGLVAPTASPGRGFATGGSHDEEVGHG